jgi:hypothetical protein
MPIAICERRLLRNEFFERSFDPLEGGFRATGEAYETFDQWIEVMPTDEIVAKEYRVEE